MVLAFNGGMLTLPCFYAFLNAVDSLLAGGRQLDLDWRRLRGHGLRRVLRHVFLRARVTGASAWISYARRAELLMSAATPRRCWSPLPSPGR